MSAFALASLSSSSGSAFVDMERFVKLEEPLLETGTVGLTPLW